MWGESGGRRSPSPRAHSWSESGGGDPEAPGYICGFFQPLTQDPAVFILMYSILFIKLEIACKKRNTHTHTHTKVKKDARKKGGKGERETGGKEGKKENK